MIEKLRVAGQYFMILAVGVGVYTGIRADLAEVREKAETAARVAVRAHDRIDTLILRKGN